MIIGLIIWAPDADGVRISRLRVNAGATIIASVAVTNCNAGWDEQQVIACTYDFVVDDYVYLEVYHTAGAALNVRLQSNFSPEFMMQRIG